MAAIKTETKTLKAMVIRPAFGALGNSTDLVFTGGLDLYLQIKEDEYVTYLSLSHETVQQFIDAITHCKKLPSTRTIPTPSEDDLEKMSFEIHQTERILVPNDTLAKVNSNIAITNTINDLLADLDIGDVKNNN